MDKIAYLKGLLDGQEVDRTKKEGKVFHAIVEALEELADRNEKLEKRVAELEELCDILDEDLGDMEDLLWNDDEDDDEDEESFCDYCTGDCMNDDSFDDALYDAICPTCGERIPLDETTLEEGQATCPNCGEEMEFDFSPDELEALLPADDTEDTEE